MIFVVGVILTTVLTSPAISQPQGPHPQSQPQPQPQPQPQGPQPAPVLPQNVFSDDPHSNYVPKPPAPGPKGEDYKSKISLLLRSDHSLIAHLPLIRIPLEANIDFFTN